MIKIEKTTIEMVVDAKLISKKKGGQFLAGLCKDVTTSGERSTFIAFAIYDESLASKLAQKATKGKRLVVTKAELRSRRYDDKHGNKQSAVEVVVEAATAVK